MELVFKGGSELIKYEMDREKKQLIVRSSKTNYQQKQLPWRYLFDRGKETVQERITDKYNDDEFMTAIKQSMSVFGYSLVSSGNLKEVELPESK